MTYFEERHLERFGTLPNNNLTEWFYECANPIGCPIDFILDLLEKTKSIGFYFSITQEGDADGK